MNRTGKHTKKFLLISVGIVVLMVAVVSAIFMSKGKAGESNEDIDITDSTKVAIEQTLEYGDDIKDKTFTIHSEAGTKEANFADLDPEVDTMTVGKTEHQLELEDEIFDVTIVVEDTQKPVIKGVKDVIEFEEKEVDIEEELKKLITAEDLVDGELDVVFEIEEDKDKENNYNVTAEATDANGNKTTERFEVVVKVVVKEEKADKKDEENKSSSVASKSENDTKPTKEKPKQAEPKQENPKQEEPKTEEPKQEEQPPALDTGAPPLKSPSGLPSGATLSQELLPSYHMYSYSRLLPGGGSITAVDVSSDYGGSATMVGTDNDGNSFIASYYVSDNKMYYQMIGPMDKPSFTQDDKSLLFEVGRDFTRAYGM